MKLTKMTKYALFAACAIMFASCAQTEKKETISKTEAK